MNVPLSICVAFLCSSYQQMEGLEGLGAWRVSVSVTVTVTAWVCCPCPLAWQGAGHRKVDAQARCARDAPRAQRSGVPEIPGMCSTGAGADGVCQSSQMPARCVLHGHGLLATGHHGGLGVWVKTTRARGAQQIRRFSRYSYHQDNTRARGFGQVYRSLLVSKARGAPRARAAVPEYLWYSNGA